ncbi:MAG TPA: phosphoribosylaminoimidazolesuccinocarboxamide synthase [Candidatus Polarisedimenticolia bacterium]|nr:phosphoribosylaminoimidazolesuccinocarboxamide synthase [Candidatus Polarisedimenticolia bacterium]
MTAPEFVLETHLSDLILASRGKVRDIYQVGGDLLIVSTDRISAFDYVLPNGIPDKGKVLNQLSLFWFAKTREIVPNHLITGRFTEFPATLRPHAAVLAGRSTLARKASMFPAECVVRGYLAGSGWKEYQKTRSVSGVPLPAGLKESSKLPEPIFTPSTKATTGHDENISMAQLEQLVGSDTARRLKELSLAVYLAASRHAESAGILIADTKFEFGTVDGSILLADEVLTPDSSRFWPADGYAPGRSQDSFDKQYVRNYLEGIGWNKQPPVPTLPPEVVAGTRDRYLEIFRRLTGKPALEE